MVRVLSRAGWISDFHKMAEAELSSTLIRRWREGDDGARDRLFEILYSEFATIASALLRRETNQVSLFTSDLVNEAVVRIFNASNVEIADRAHLLALSARVMRRVLLDAARRRNRQKRRSLHVTFSEAHGGDASASADYEALERALVRLTAIDADRAEIVEMRYFAGLTIDEIAHVKGVSASTVKRSWEAARLWLKEAMEHDIGG